MTPLITRSLVLCGLSVLCPVASASLIWKADFKDYNTGGGAVPLVVNSSGKDNTFTATIPNKNISAPVQRVARADAPAFMSGNALYLGGTGSGGNVSFMLQQNAIVTSGYSGVLIASFDMYNASVSAVSMTAEARTTTGRIGKTSYSASTPTATPLRVTIVINRIGSAIILPGNLGSLATDSLAIYRFDGIKYDGLSISEGISNKITGFATGFSLSSSEPGFTYGVWFDNFAAWDSLSDTLDGKSVLELAPGA
jgi:hypothetical protein